MFMQITRRNKKMIYKIFSISDSDKVFVFNTKAYTTLELWLAGLATFGQGWE